MSSVKYYIHICDLKILHCFPTTSTNGAHIASVHRYSLSFQCARPAARGHLGSHYRRVMNVAREQLVLLVGKTGV